MVITKDRVRPTSADFEILRYGPGDDLLFGRLFAEQGCWFIGPPLDAFDIRRRPTEQNAYSVFFSNSRKVA